MQGPGARVEGRRDAELRVGEWRVIPALNQLCRGAEVVRLEPKTIELLSYLAERPGEVVSREELLAAVWPGVIVGDNALTQTVAKLRRALGDTARAPAYIEAISKRGYRLVAPVGRDDTAPSPAAQRNAAAVTASPTSRRFPLPALAAGVLAIGAIMWYAGTAPDVADGTSPVEPTAAPSPAARPLPVVIVRPLDVASEDAQLILIARGVAADLVTDLSKVASLRVVHGPASEHAAAAATDKSAASVRYVVTGSAQRDGHRLRLHVQLSDGGDGRQLWSQRFEAQTRDLFSVQDDLARRILAVLPVKVSEAESLRLAQRYTRNLVAYEHFLRGQAALLVRRRAQNDLARELYWKAIHADPAFSRAYAGVAMTYALAYQQGWVEEGPALSRALELAHTAAQISPDMPEAHWVIGFVHTQRRAHDEALRHLNDALRLNPSYADAYALKGGIHTFIGKPAETIGLLRTAFRLNPDAGSLYFLVLGRAYFHLGDLEQARVNLQQALTRNAENLEARVYVAATMSLAGDAEAAAWQADEIRTIEPRFKVRQWLASFPMTDASQRQQLQSLLEALGF